jgi:hypothetical protein
MLPSSHPAIVFTGMLVVITFPCNQHFGLADLGQKGAEGEVSSTVIPTFHVNSICGLSTSPRIRILHNKLVAAQLVKKFSAFYVAQMFVTALTRASH